MTRIITDTTADFEPHELKSLNIDFIPLTVIFGDQEYQEHINLTKDQFYRLLEKSPESPKTAQPSPHYLEDLFRQAHDAGVDAVCITISSQLSGTYQSAVMVQRELGWDNCCVVDSLSGTGGHRLLVEHAVKLRDQGKGAREIAAELEKLRERVILYTCMDTLEYLYRGGRISHAVYTIGSLAHIKPIMHVSPEGRAVIPAKMLGLRKGVEYLCRQPGIKKPDPAFPFYVMYTDVRTNGELLADRLRELGYDIPDANIIPVGAAIGTHIGPNACAIVYICEEGTVNE